MLWNFTTELPHIDREEFLAEISRINRQRAEKMAVSVIALMALLIVALDYPLYADGKWTENPFNKYLFFLHTALIGLYAIWFGAGKVLKNSKKDKILSAAFCYISVLWCAYFTHVGQLVHADIIVYIIGLFCISTLFYFTSVARTVFLISVHIFFLAGTNLFPMDEHAVLPNYVNSTVSVILCWLINRFLLKTRIRDFMQYKELEKQRDEITQLNAELIEANREAETLNEHLNESNKQLIMLHSEKNEFLAIAAHDLKNPLAGIMLNAELVRSYGHTLSMGEIREYMDRIENTSRHMRDILSNLLNIHALETGKFLFSKEKINIGESLRNILSEYEARAKEKNIILHFTDGEEICSVIDHAAFIAIVENLLSNAIKFSPRGKNIFVRLEFDKAEENFRIEIEDEGPGLTREDKEKLFTKFAKLSAKPTASEHSTGLGLSIVKKMVESLGGKISCESEAGAGAKFIVELPYCEKILTE